MSGAHVWMEAIDLYVLCFGQHSFILTVVASPQCATMPKGSSDDRLAARSANSRAEREIRARAWKRIGFVTHHCIS